MTETKPKKGRRVMRCRVVDDRTNETLFEGEKFECMRFIINNFDEEDENFLHIWIEDLILQ